jgi:hypothetical protein
VTFSETFIDKIKELAGERSAARAKPLDKPDD